MRKLWSIYMIDVLENENGMRRKEVDGSIEVPTSKCMEWPTTQQNMDQDGNQKHVCCRGGGFLVKLNLQAIVHFLLLSFSHSSFRYTTHDWQRQLLSKITT
ncbi:hypothetical protein VNO78_19777 [Psophocarpus tetragonolobus]|uniref:Uncharacterized protein n=1 Tax=Psophocarpus tetragonolobus TaxID=3891 RepID=A0AAN9SCK1_PSOTE